MSGGKDLEITANTEETQRNKHLKVLKRRHFNLYEDQQILRDFGIKEGLVASTQIIADLQAKLDVSADRVKERLKKLVSLPPEQKKLILSIGGPNEEDWINNPLIILQPKDKLPLQPQKLFVYFLDQGPKAIQAITTLSHGQWSTKKATSRVNPDEEDPQQAMLTYLENEVDPEGRVSRVKSSMRSKALS